MINAKEFIDKSIEDIKNQIGDEKAIIALSGGVDSAVTAALVYKAIGKQLTCIFVDTGLMRKDEGIQVKNSFLKAFENINFKYVSAQDTFFRNLKGIIDPEEKRKCIGKTFIDVFKDKEFSVSGFNLGRFFYVLYAYGIDPSKITLDFDCSIARYVLTPSVKAQSLESILFEQFHINTEDEPKQLDLFSAGSSSYDNAVKKLVMMNALKDIQAKDITADVNSLTLLSSLLSTELSSFSVLSM